MGVIRSLISGLVLMMSAEANAQDFYVFGDSLSDNGNFYAVANETYPPSTTYWNGRASNGATWSERLGYQLGTMPNLDSLTPPDGGFSQSAVGYNFAHYGATVTPGLRAHPGQHLFSQARAFRVRANRGFLNVDPQSRFAIWAGTNDYLAFSLTNARPIVKSIIASAKEIRSVGGQNILILDMPDWSYSPYGYSRGDREALSNRLRWHNTLLRQRVDSYRARSGADVHVARISLLFLDVLQNPNSYGFSVIEPGSGTTGHCVGDNLILEACPSSYMYYDSIHPSAAMHDVIASYVNAQFLALDAEDAYSGIAVSAASPALAYHARALHSLQRGAAQDGWVLRSAGATTLISFTEETVTPEYAFETAFDALAREDQFSLVGLRSVLPGDTEIGFVLSSGTPEPVLTTGHPVTAASGWAVELSRPVLGVDLSLRANGIEQSFERQRATGFVRDPVVTATFEQAQSLTMFGADRNTILFGLNVGAGGSIGLAQQRRSAVTEAALTNLVTRNAPAEIVNNSAGEFHLTAEMGGGEGSRNWNAGARLAYGRLDGEAWSAWALLSEQDFTHTDYIGAREAVLLSGFAGFGDASGFSGGAQLSIGQSDLEPVQAARLHLSYRW